MDIGKAILYPAKDWKRVFHLILSIIGIVTIPAFLGYNLAVIRSVAAGEEDLLPEWEFGDYWIDGFKVNVVLVIYMIPVIIFASIVGSVDSQSYLPVILALIFVFPIIFMYLIGLMRYSVEETLEVFFELPKNFEILQKHFFDFIWTVLLIYAINIFVGGVSALLSITICLGFVTLSYAYLVNSYLLGKLSKRIKITPPDEIVFQPPLPTPEIPSSTQSHHQEDLTQNYQTAVDSSTMPGLIHNLETATVYEIQVPKGEKLEPERAVAIIEQVIVGVLDLTFAIVAESGKISWQIWDLRQELNPMVIKQSITDVYPKAQVTVKPFEQTPFTEPFWRAVLLYQQGLDFVAPIKYISECVKLDPLATLVNGMGDLRAGERVMHFIHIPSLLTEKSYQDAFKRITRSSFNLQGGITSWEGAGKLVGSTLSQLANQSRTGKYDSAHQQIYEERLASHLLLNCYLLTQIDLPDYERMSKFVGIFKSMLQFRGEENFIVQSEELTPKDVQVQNAQQDKTSSAIALLGKWIDGTDLRYKKAKMVLSTQEIAALWHLPHEAFTTSEIDWQDMAIPTKELLANREGVAIGNSNIAGQKHPIFIHPSDRTTHMNIIGRTGVGKSTFMHNLIHQDIQAGKGVGVVDPHGKLISDILRASIPDNRLDDVCVLDIANEEFPPPLNPLLGSIGDDSYTASEIVNILDKSERMGLPERVTDTLTAALVTLRHEPSPTVRDVVKLFENAEYRHEVLNRVLHKVVDVTTHEFWEKFEQQSAGMQENLTYPVIHRMRKFYRNPILHLMMCHPDRLDFSELIKQNKILLVSLGIDQRKVPDIERELVGMVIMSQLQMAGMSSLANPTPFYLYVDEVQNFVTSPLNKVFEEARKYELHLTVANQFLGQLIGKTLESVMGTVGATVVFQIGEKDAYILSPYFRPVFTSDELVNQSLYQAAVKTRLQGKTMPAFTITTNEPPGDTSSKDAQERELMIRQRSIQNCTPKTKEEVLEWLSGRYPPPSFPAAPNNPADSPSGMGWVDPTNS